MNDGYPSSAPLPAAALAARVLGGATPVANRLVEGAAGGGLQNSNLSETVTGAVLAFTATLTATRTKTFRDGDGTVAELQAAQTWTAAQTGPSGTAAACAWAVGTAGNGLFSPGSNQVAIATGGVERWRWSGVQFAGGQLAGSDSGFFAGTSAPALQAHATNGVACGFARWSADAQGSFVILAKSRGTALGSYTSVGASDELGGLFFEGANGTHLATAASIRAYAESTFSSSITASLRFGTHNGTSLAERMRLRPSGGLDVGVGSDPGAGGIAATATIRTGTYTVAGLPAAGTAGRRAFATNGRKNGEGAGAGTGVAVFDDGTAWRACDTGATVAA